MIGKLHDWKIARIVFNLPSSNSVKSVANYFLGFNINSGTKDGWTIDPSSTIETLLVFRHSVKLQHFFYAFGNHFYFPPLGSHTGRWVPSPQY